ncbi:MAG: hypothetical protein MI867_22075 [Pseudomonadales bacterium]|nr:hypothetical protein [Pseudomonadales bacterium]
MQKHQVLKDYHWRVMDSSYQYDMDEVMTKDKVISFQEKRKERLERTIAAFVNGYIAFKGGFLLADCPYDDESVLFIAWIDGWKEAFEDTAQGIPRELKKIQILANELYV